MIMVAYATKYKDPKNPLLVSYLFLLAACCAYVGMTPDWSIIQLGISFIVGVGQAGPLVLLPTITQFTAPHAYLSTATGFMFAIRALGGAFGSAVVDTILNSYISSHYTKAVTAAVAPASLPAATMKKLVAAMKEGAGKTLVKDLGTTLPDVSIPTLEAAVEAGHWVYAKGYRVSWASIIPFVVLSMACTIFLKGVKKLMTEKVEAPVEKMQQEGERDNSPA